MSLRPLASGETVPCSTPRARGSVRGRPFRLPARDEVASVPRASMPMFGIWTLRVDTIILQVWQWPAIRALDVVDPVAPHLEPCGAAGLEQMLPGGVQPGVGPGEGVCEWLGQCAHDLGRAGQTRTGVS